MVIYIESLAADKIHSGSVYGWINKSIRSTAKCAKVAAHANALSRARSVYDVSIMILCIWHWGVLQEVHIEECEVLQA